jgi:hypothetical protein
VYEQPSLHMELARQRHRDYEIDAARARLAAQVERPPSEGLNVIRSVLSGLRNALSHRRPEVVHEVRLQPAA